MKLRTSRVSTMVLVGLFALAACGPKDKDNVIVVAVGGGEWADANIKAYVAPFERETGIRVVPVRDDLELSRLKLMEETGQVDIDVGNLGAVQAMQAARLGYLTPIDYTGFDPTELQGLQGETRRKWGVGSLYYAIVIGFDTSIAGPQPKTWADIWNITRFPGLRTFMNGRVGTGPIEEALLADGVPADKLYPLDLDRAFAKLDQIKPHIIKWWNAGSEGEQLFRDRQVRAGELYDARLATLKAAGKPVGFTYNQGKRLIDYWIIPKGAPNAVAAQKFIAFATRAKQQAAFVSLMPYGPTNQRAFALVPERLARQLPSHPENLKRQFSQNHEWYAALRPDGRSNLDHVIDRWNRWVTQ